MPDRPAAHRPEKDLLSDPRWMIQMGVKQLVRIWWWVCTVVVLGGVRLDLVVTGLGRMGNRVQHGRRRGRPDRWEPHQR